VRDGDPGASLIPGSPTPWSIRVIGAGHLPGGERAILRA
jgi:hypothetical protein